MATILETKQAEPSSYGILGPAATRIVHDNNEHWVDGFSYKSLSCGTGINIGAVCATSNVTVVSPGDTTRFRDYIPFDVQTTFACSTFSYKDGSYTQEAVDRLDACLQKGLEYEFWTGTFAKALQTERTAASNPVAVPNRFLASPNSTDVTPTPGTAIKPRYGLALLEKALANCGCGTQGTIHATHDVASALFLPNKDGSLVTSLNTKVIAGTGYTGTGPNGTQPSGAARWMYATGPVTVQLGQVEVVGGDSASVNRSVNTVNVYASRPAAVTWDTCCQFAVLVDISLDYA